MRRQCGAANRRPGGAAAWLRGNSSGGGCGKAAPWLGLTDARQCGGSSEVRRLVGTAVRKLGRRGGAAVRRLGITAARPLGSAAATVARQLGRGAGFDANHSSTTASDTSQAACNAAATITSAIPQPELSRFHVDADLGEPTPAPSRNSRHVAAARRRERPPDHRSFFFFWQFGSVFFCARAHKNLNFLKMPYVYLKHCLFNHFGRKRWAFGGSLS